PRLRARNRDAADGPADPQRPVARPPCPRRPAEHATRHDDRFRDDSAWTDGLSGSAAAVLSRPSANGRTRHGVAEKQRSKEKKEDGAGNVFGPARHDPGASGGAPRPSADDR